jgi:hypothetical protein
MSNARYGLRVRSGLVRGITQGLAVETPLLDIYPNAAAAYSLRKLRSAYTGNAIRVRRSNDNAEQDIGFLNEVLDTAALLSFVGANNGFVTTWYDQSGNGLNVIQTSSTNQPRIVNSGVVEIENVNPAIRFLGNQWLNGGNILSVGTANNMATFAVARTLGTLNSDVFFKGIQPTGANEYSLTFTNGTTTSFVQNNANVDVRSSINNILTTQQLYNTEFIRNTSNRLLRNNSQVAITTASVGVIGSSGDSFTVGALLSSNTTLVRGLDGLIQEIIIYHLPTTPTLSNVNTNINSFYNIYP